MIRRITKSKLALAILAVALLVPATAVATHIFNDVEDSRFYADPIEWALNNNITTGSPAGSDTFKPDDPVTRGESVTFLNRYDTNIVQPGLTGLRTDVDANTAAAAANTTASAANTTATAANTTATAANTGSIATNTAAIANLPDVYFVEVDADGTKMDGSFGTSVSNPSTGIYEVAFPVDDVNDCTWSATIAQKGSNLFGFDTTKGEIYLQSDLDGPFPLAVRDIDSILVGTSDSAGTNADRPFHLQITCGLPTLVFIPPILPLTPLGE